MRSPNPIEHKGIIAEAGKDTLKIHLIEETSCASCHIQDSCALSNRKDKIVEASFIKGVYNAGDMVTIVNEPTLGAKAIFLGYILPFLLVVCTLFISYALTGSEAKSGLFSLLVLVPYYAGLYLFRDKLKKTFEFKLKEK